eukprot:403371304
MGTKISIDKHVSTLDDILEMPPSYFDKIKFESKISQNITQHLKIWKFSEDKRKFDSVKSTPVQLHNLQNSGFFFSSEDAYLILLVYKAGSEAQSDLVSFPHSLWGVVNSTTENLTPRGLQNAFASNEEDKYLNHQFDSFLLSKRREDQSKPHMQDEEMKDETNNNGQGIQQSNSSEQQQFKYMIFVWNGKQAGALVKASALTKGYELDELLTKAKDAVLQVFFSGGVIRGKKLQRSNVLVFDDVSADNKKPDGQDHLENPNTPSTEELIKAYETVYLLKWLLPEKLIQKQIQQLSDRDRLVKPKFQNFMQTFQKLQEKMDYWSKFENIDDILDSMENSSEDNDNQHDDVEQHRETEPPQYDSDYNNSDEEMNDVSDRNTSDYGQEANNLVIQGNQQKPAEQLKQVLGGGLKQPAIPPMNMNKLTLSNIQNDRDQTMQEVDKKPEITKPAMGFGSKFNLDLSKAQKINQEDNGQDSQRELIEYQQQQQQQQTKKPSMGLSIPSIRMGYVENQEQFQTQQTAQPKKLGLGLGLDLSKAQSYQQENLAKNEQIISKAKQASNFQDTQAATDAPQLSINIANISKLREIDIDKSLEDAPPVHRRAREEEMIVDSQISKKILSVSSRDGSDSVDSNLMTSNRTDNLVPPEQLTDEDFDMKGTSRKEYENEYYKLICSEIIDDFLYLGSDIVAQNKEILEKNGITHVVNCAADYSANYFDGDISYKKYHLKDHIRENIECVFYDALHYIEEARKQNGKVYVHCVQGVSRSATIVLAYLIYSQKLSYQDSFNFLKERRAIANPNMTFIAQLLQFHKRLFSENFESLPVSPRVFIVSSHEIEDPERIICRMMMENLYQGKNSKVLDPRGMFLIQGRDMMRIWIGSQIPAANIEPYKKCVETYIPLLQKYERAPQDWAYVNQFEEDSSFWKLFHLDAKPQRDYETLGEWNTIFLDLDKARMQSKKAPVVTQMQDYKDIVKNEKQFKPRLFTYPSVQESQTVFDLDDLSEESFLILCVRANPDEGLEDELHIWHGPDFEDPSENDQLSIEDYIQQVIVKYWGEGKDQSEIERINQIPGQEEDDFINYFD